MLKKITNLFLIWILLVVGSFSSQVLAWTQNNSLPIRQTFGKNTLKSDFKEFFARELTKSKFDVPETQEDSEKIEKARGKLGSRKTNLEKRQNLADGLFCRSRRRSILT